MGHGASPRTGSPACRILLVDDESDILPEYQELLELEGFAALTVSQPEQAVRLVQQNPDIGVVVTDLKMAGLNGVDMIKSMRQRIAGSRLLSFIVLTGDATSINDVAALGVPILLKPVDLTALIAAIKAAMPYR